MQELYRLERDDTPNLETILYAGLNDEAVATKGMNRVSTFGICIKNETQTNRTGYCRVRPSVAFDIQRR